MSNMSYCRFRNTLGDLDDCYSNMQADELSEEEATARRALIRMACDIAFDYGEEVGREMEEVA
jgi:hypothetical protein